MSIDSLPGYDAWKAHNPADEFLGSDGLCQECEQPSHCNQQVVSPAVGYHRCACLACIEGRREFEFEREHAKCQTTS